MKYEQVRRLIKVTYEYQGDYFGLRDSNSYLFDSKVTVHGITNKSGSFIYILIDFIRYSTVSDPNGFFIVKFIFLFRKASTRTLTMFNFPGKVALVDPISP